MRCGPTKIEKRVMVGGPDRVRRQGPVQHHRVGLPAESQPDPDGGAAEGCRGDDAGLPDAELEPARLILLMMTLPGSGGERDMPSLELVLNVALGGILAGLVYGLMALGLSVIFGVVRVVNFAHGEMMTIAMYLAVTLFAAFGLDPLIMLVPIAAVLFALGYAMQAGLINPFISRPEHSQFMLLVAIASS
jgi:hypothetical protein